MALSVNYANFKVGKRKAQRSAILIPQRIRIVRDGKIISQRCRCAGFTFRNKKIQPNMTEKLEHRKDCKYAKI